MNTKNTPKDITPGTNPEPQAQPQGEAVTPEYIPAPNDLCVTANTLTFNWREEEITAWVDRIAESYSAIVVTEDAIPGIKAEMANLNGIIKQLNADRIAAVKSVSAPIKAFEDKVKALCAKIDGARDNMASQVKAFEDAAREQKRKEVLFAIETLTAEAGYPGLAIPVQDSWLNKTQKPKQTAAEIGNIILAHVKAEKDKAALEQARQDRAVAIEQQCAALAQGYGFALPVSQFLKLHDLSLALVDVHESITAAYRAKADQMARENVAPVPASAAAAAPAPQAAPMQPQVPLAAPAGSPVLKNITVSLRFDPAREGDINMALRHLEGLGVSVVRVAGPYETREIIPQQTTAPVQRAARPY